MTTADYLESLQNDLDIIVNRLDLDEGTNFTDIATMTEDGEISKGGGGYTGHYDAAGLSQIGWTAEDIQYYQDNAVYWNSDKDNDYKLVEREIQGMAGTKTRYINKNSTLTSFRSYPALIGLPLLNISKQDWSNTFREDVCLLTIPLFNTSNATSMEYMFNMCSNLRTIPLLNTGNVTSMRSMFSYCYNLKSVPLLNTSNVTKINYMFSNCCSLREIPQFDTSKVITMAYTFQNCNALTTIPVLNTSKVEDFTATFGYCYNLSDESLNNILLMCANATSYTGMKNFSTLGLDTSTYSNRASNLSNFTAFTNAGWSTQ